MLTFIQRYPGYGVGATLWALVTAEAPALTIAGWALLAAIGYLHSVWTD